MGSSRAVEERVGAIVRRASDARGHAFAGSDPPATATTGGFSSSRRESSASGNVPGYFPSSRQSVQDKGPMRHPMLPDLCLRWNPTRPVSTFLETWGADGSPSAHKLPPLGRPLEGSRSAPCLFAHELGWKGGTSSFRATLGGEGVNLRKQSVMTAASYNSFAGSERPSQCNYSTSRATTGKVNGKKWTASNARAYREQVLQKDRQRAKTFWYDGPSRQACSPARSHAASLFFAQVPGGEEASSLLPPGALRHVARPQTRCMDSMPNLEVTMQMNSTVDKKGSKGKSPLKGGSAAGGADASGEKVDATLAFEANEILQLGRAIEQYIAFVPLPPGASPAERQDSLGGANPGASPTAARSTTPARAQRQGSVLERENSLSASPGSTNRRKTKEDTELLLLRPLFCRFLLSSNLCGRSSAILRYHECVAEFDKLSVKIGAFSCVPRTDVVKLICSIVLPPEDPLEDVGARNKSSMQDGSERRSSSLLSCSRPGTSGFGVLGAGNGGSQEESMQLVAMQAQRNSFFSQHLPSALAHLEARQQSVQGRVERICPLMPAMEPISEATGTGTSTSSEKAVAAAEAAAEEAQAQVQRAAAWPPLPPRCVPPEELPTWLTGFRQWDEELSAQNSQQLLALRTHTETVLRGEVLVAQLLEPEVLHFATRFRPLFTRLFSEYFDYCVPHDITQQPESSRDSARNQKDQVGELVPSVPEIIEGPSSFREHMSFGAFFRFCVDFGLFPDHANFTEIRQIYHDAETTVTIAKPPAQQVRSKSAGSAALNGGKDGKERARGRRVSTISHVSHDNEAEREKDPKKAAAQAASNRRKAAERAAATAAAEAAAEAGSILDLAFMQLPVEKLSDFQLQTIGFLAAVDDWLSERFVRLPDIVGMAEEEEGVYPKIVLRRGSTSGSLPGANLRRKEEKPMEREPSRSHSRRASAPPMVLQAQTNGGEPPMVPQLEKIAHPPAVRRVSAEKLLEVLSQMTGGRSVGEAAETLPSEEEMRSVFRLLLADGGAANGAEGSSVSCDIFQLDKAVRKAREALDRYAQGCCSLLRTSDQPQHPAYSALPDKQRAMLKEATTFFEAFDLALYERSRWDGGEVEDVFAEHRQLTPEMLLEIGQRVGVPPEQMPPGGAEALKRLLTQLGGASDGSSISRSNMWRALVLARERRRSRDQKTLRTRLACLAHNQSNGGATVFGLPSFVECLLKLALHGLYSKGSSDLQRTAPNWWKCTWLLTLLSGRFAEQVRLMRYEACLQGLTKTDACSRLAGDAGGRLSSIASSQDRAPSSLQGAPPVPPPAEAAEAASQRDDSVVSQRSREAASVPSQAEPARQVSDGMPSRMGSTEAATKRLGSRTVAEVVGSAAIKEAEEAMKMDLQTAKDLHVWWTHVRTKQLPRYMPPMERLVVEEPQLFEPAFAEAPADCLDPDEPAETCSACEEHRSPSGWGSPGCMLCSCVEELCLPLEDHLFAKLLPRVELPQEDGESQDGSEAEAPP